MSYESTIFGVPMSEVKDAIFFYQKFKETPTYQETFKQLKREHLESELARISKELGELE